MKDLHIKDLETKSLQVAYQAAEGEEASRKPFPDPAVDRDAVEFSFADIQAVQLLRPGNGILPIFGPRVARGEREDPAVLEDFIDSGQRRPVTPGWNMLNYMTAEDRIDFLEP